MSKEIDRLTNSFRLIVNNCLGNLDVDALTEIKNRTADLIKQESFWIEEENTERYVYELRKFLTWLADYVEIKENEFWGEHEPFDLSELDEEDGE